MSKQKNNVQLKVTQRIKKFNPGSDINGEPDEIIEKSFVCSEGEMKLLMENTSIKNLVC